MATVAGRTVYEGETIYSARGSRVIFTYWNSTGGVGTGIVEVVGDRVHIRGAMRATATSAEKPLKAEWALVPNGYDVIDDGTTSRPFRRAD